MYSAKTFYELAGIKRSTVRHYLEEGLIEPASVLDNGYAVYDDSQLLDIILIKSERSLNFGVQEISTYRTLSVNQKIDTLENQKQELQQEIQSIQRKIETLQLYQRILREMAEEKDRIRLDRKGRRSYQCLWIEKATQYSPKKTALEIAHCIEAFPRVTVILRARKNAFIGATQCEIPMEIGYKFESGKEDYKPLYPELYEPLPGSPSILLRTVTAKPLDLPHEVIKPIETSFINEGLHPSGALYAYIHAVENSKDSKLYYMTIRAVIAE